MALEPAREVRTLERLAAALYRYVDSLFAGDPLLRRYVERRVGAAYELVTRRSRLRLVRPVGYRAYRVVFASSELLERPWPRRRIAIRALDGRTVVVEAGVEALASDRSLHFVEVSPWMLRCSCPDAVFASAAADAVAAREGAAPAPVFHRYSICKHVLASLALLASEGALSLEDPNLRRSLVMGLVAAYARLRRRLPGWARHLVRESAGVAVN